MLSMLEEHMLRPRSSSPLFGEISSIPPNSSDGGSSPSDPQDNSLSSSPSNTSPQESTYETRINQENEDETAGASPLSEVSEPFLPLAPTHALVPRASPSIVKAIVIGMVA
jgi:hypothetical protein